MKQENMFFLLCRILGEEKERLRISDREYFDAIVKLAIENAKQKIVF